MSENIFLGPVQKCQKMDQKSAKMSENVFGIEMPVVTSRKLSNFKIIQ